MGLYNKLSLQMVYDLLNASNTLPIPIDSTQAKFGTPSAIVPANGTIQDTTVKVIALAAGQYVGNQALTYRRVNLVSLFRSVPLRIDLYSAAAVNQSPYSMAQLLPYINAKYGLNLQAADITSVAFPAGNTNANPSYGVAAGTRNAVANLTIPSTNLAWSPISIPVCWVQAPQDLGTLLATPNLETALTYPGLVDTVSSAIYVPNMDVYYTDFTDIFTSLSFTPAAWNGAALTTAAAYTPIITAINQASGKTYTVGQGNPQGSVAMDITGALMYGAIDLTQAANQALYPEADYRYFNRLLVLKLQPVNLPWGAGDMMLHYNV